MVSVSSQQPIYLLVELVLLVVCVIVPFPAAAAAAETGVEDVQGLLAALTVAAPGASVVAGRRERATGAGRAVVVDV